jgi:hypothetical protein
VNSGWECTLRACPDCVDCGGAFAAIVFFFFSRTTVGCFYCSVVVERSLDCLCALYRSRLLSSVHCDETLVLIPFIFVGQLALSVLLDKPHDMTYDSVVCVILLVCGATARKSDWPVRAGGGEAGCRLSYKDDFIP